jgi:hypothetical protein
LVKLSGGAVIVHAPPKGPINSSAIIVLRPISNLRFRRPPYLSVRQTGSSSTHQLHFVKVMGFAGLNPRIDNKTGSSDLPVGRLVDRRVESPLQKYFASPVGQIISTNSRHPVPQEGRIAIVTDAGWDAVDAAASGVKRDAGRV